MQMENLIFSQIQVNELISAISNDVLEKLTPLFPAMPPPDTSRKTEKYLTRKEVAALIGISLPTLHKYTITGRIKAYRINRQVRYLESEVLAALAQIQTI